MRMRSSADAKGQPCTILCHLVTTKVTFELTQDHWYSCHSIGHT